jgi:hypothetical protein
MIGTNLASYHIKAFVQSLTCPPTEAVRAFTSISLTEERYYAHHCCPYHLELSRFHGRVLIRHQAA